MALLIQKIMACVRRSSFEKMCSTLPLLSLQFTHRSRIQASIPTGESLSPYAIDSVLRIVHTLIQAKEGGFLLHGASAIRNGRAFVFSGVSGAGKTTISRLAPADSVLLTDEISYIRREGDSYCACGTPFAGELARLGANEAAPIERLYFLAKGPKNNIDPIDTGDALRMLLRNILFFADDEDLVKMVFRSACEFLGRVPAFRLTFYPDERVWDLIQ